MPKKEFPSLFSNFNDKHKILFQFLACCGYLWSLTSGQVSNRRRSRIVERQRRRQHALRLGKHFSTFVIFQLIQKP